MPVYRLAAILLLLSALQIPSSFAKEKGGASVAEVGGTKITEGQMRQDIGPDIFDAETSLYQLKKNWIDQKAKGILFEQAAKKAGLSLEDWQRREIENKVAQPSDADLKSIAQQILRQQKTGNPPDAAMVAQADKKAREYLLQQLVLQRENELYQELLKRQPMKLLLKKPEVFKVDVAFSRQDPVSGPEKAPITILAFTDFQCPYCRKGHETMKEVEKAYPGKIRFVIREFPLDFHKRARASAEAALCAGGQGQFWAYADKLFANQQRLEDADLLRYAEELKLNGGEFGQCLSSHKFAAQIERDVADGGHYGVHGTPAYFVNGRFMSGAQPLSNFKEAIDEELARKK